MKKSERSRSSSITFWIQNFVVTLLLVTAFILTSTVGSNSVSAIPNRASAFHGLSPYRVLDTRPDPGSVLDTRPVAGSVTEVSIGGVPIEDSEYVPDSATAVVLNVTATDTVGQGYVTLFPWGERMPDTSNVNIMRSGQTVANLVTVRLGADGKVGLFTSIAANLVVDVFGYYSPSGATAAGRFIAITPTRILNTRDHVMVEPGGFVHLPIPSDVPVDTEGLVLNVTAVNSRIRVDGSGYWTAYPAGEDRGTTSNINISVPGQTIPNQVIVKPSATGIDFYSYAGGDLLVDLMGYYSGETALVSEGGLFVPVSPTRLLDTRTSPNPLGVNVALHDGWTVEVATAGRAGIPNMGASAVALNVTATHSQGGGYVTAYPAGRSLPDSSNLNADKAGMTAPNHVQVATGSRGVSFYSYGGTDLIVDIFGWFVGSPQIANQGMPVNPFPAPEGFPGYISIPQIGLTSLVRSGTQFVSLDPSHLVESRTPNQPGNVAIFGHRVSHGHEFRNLDKLGANSLVYLYVGGKVYTYRVTGVDIRLPSDPLLYATVSNDQTLSLVACHPLHSVKFRIVVHAELIDIAQF